MTHPFFSIITVTFNAKDTLGITAHSIQEQNTEDFEWIVVDGASTDGTADLARRHARPERDTVISEPDDGLYDAMNKGLREAGGEVVQFLNAGDRFASPDVLSNVFVAFREEVDAVYGDTVLSMPDGRMIPRPGIAPETSIHRRMPFSHQSLFVRRHCHLQHMFDTRFRIAADKAAIASMCRAGATFAHAGIVTNVNTIELEAVSIAGKVRSASEDYQINVDILGLPRRTAVIQFLRKRIVIFGVGMLERLPRPIFNLLPKRIRDRVY